MGEINSLQLACPCSLQIPTLRAGNCAASSRQKKTRINTFPAALHKTTANYRDCTQQRPSSHCTEPSTEHSWALRVLQTTHRTPGDPQESQMQQTICQSFSYRMRKVSPHHLLPACHFFPCRSHTCQGRMELL